MLFRGPGVESAHGKQMQPCLFPVNTGSSFTLAFEGNPIRPGGRSAEGHTQQVSCDTSGVTRPTSFSVEVTLAAS